MLATHDGQMDAGRHSFCRSDIAEIGDPAGAFGVLAENPIWSGKAMKGA